LFPGSPALEEDERDFVANWVDDRETWRLTATLPLLARARRMLFLVSGAHKAQIVAEILEHGSDHPAAIVSRSARDAAWMLDHAAASALSTS
jgi:6-phosphogluconolactonase